MRILENALSEYLLDDVDKTLSQYLDNNVWKSSDAYWDPSLNRGSTGIVNQAKCEIHLSKKIENELKKYFPSYNYLEVSFYVWYKNSSISLHCDSNSIFGATIYLNEFWHPEWGGFFMWYENFLDKSLDEIFLNQNPNTILPKRNVMILNDKKEYHMVTNINPCSSSNRYTIQIWGK